MSGESPDLRAARQALELAQAELESFERRNANVWYSSKDHDRWVLTERREDAWLNYIRVRQVAEGGEPSAREQAQERQAIDPIATPEQAKEAYGRLRSERLAAGELGVSKTHVRRLLGKDD